MISDGYEYIMYKYAVACYQEQEEYKNYQMINPNASITNGINIAGMINFRDTNGTRSDLNASYLNTLLELTYTNETLFELYKMHEWILAHNGINEDNTIRIRSYMLSKYSKIIKNIVHDVKSATDQLISIASLHSHTNEYIDSVGQLLKHKDDEKDFFNNYMESIVFLKQLNDMDNSYKHHITNYIKKYFDREKPVITVFYCKNYSKGYGADKRDIFIEKPMDEFINESNEFILSMKSLLRELSCSLESN